MLQQHGQVASDTKTAHADVSLRHSEGLHAYIQRTVADPCEEVGPAP